jgi:hypothetical protein
MQAISRVAAVLLLGVMSTIVLGVPSFALTDPPAHPAGCHSHQSSAPAPVSYRCCVAGHHAAIPGVSFSGQFPLLYLCKASEGEQYPTASIGSHAFSILILSSAHSPGLAPLRI